MPSKTEPMSRDTIAMIFRSLRGRFGNAFVEKFRSGRKVPDGQPQAGMDVGLLEAMDVWAHELRGLTQAEIRHAMDTKFKYPPSADEFVTAACNRDYSAHPANTLPALPPAQITELDRQAAAKHIGTIASTVKRMGMGQFGLRLDWAENIAKEVAAGHYKGGAYGARMAAEALLAGRRTVPASLVPFLPVPANDDAQEAA